MADVETISQTKIAKNSKIVVNVEEALQDIFVVTFAYDNRLFQGVLLDSSKKMAPRLAAATRDFPGRGKEGEEDLLFGVSQRFGHLQHVPVSGGSPKGGNDPLPPFHLPRPVRPAPRFRGGRTTVRLRPRQVLCSKCRSICNENSENVDFSARKRGGPEVGRKAGAPSQSPRPLYSAENRRDGLRGPYEGSPLHQTNAPVSSSKIEIVGNYWIGPSGEGEGMHSRSAMGEGGGAWGANGGKLDGGERAAAPRPPRSSAGGGGDHLPGAGTPGEDAGSGRRMVLRKKRSVGSMEDLWDESVFEDGAKGGAPLTDPSGRPHPTTPIIKISFGSQGKGTVLEIPARVRGPPSGSPCDGTEGEAVDGEPGTVVSIGGRGGGWGGGDGMAGSTPNRVTGDAGARAARKALKKAKREARRQRGPPGLPSPAGRSPSAFLMPQQQYEALRHRRHKRKVKHKRRRKEGRRHREEGSDEGTLEVEEASYTAIKERCLTQRLSISLRRLNANAYMRCDSVQLSSDLPEQEGEVVRGPGGKGLTVRISKRAMDSSMSGGEGASSGPCTTSGDAAWDGVDKASCPWSPKPEEPAPDLEIMGDNPQSWTPPNRAPLMRATRERCERRRRSMTQGGEGGQHRSPPVLAVCGSPREVDVVS